jgi:RNA polymerase sigma-B factor
MMVTARDPSAGSSVHDLTDRDGLNEAFREFRSTEDLALRNRIVESNTRLAEYHVRRFAGRGIAEDDLRQIASLAIVSAVDRFDPEVGVAFSTFANRTIEGELKRYLRDRSWSVRPPRRAQELHLEIRRAEEELTQLLGRSPTVAEIAVEVRESEDHVLEAMEAGAAHRASSIDQPTGSDDGSGTATIADRRLGSVDHGYTDVEQRIIVEELLQGLDERERTILELRFFERLSQEEIAERLGVSQSYLSRLLRRTLLELRARVDD